MVDEAYAYKKIKEYKRFLYADQRRQLKGQIRAGDPDGAMKGLRTILHNRWGCKHGATAQKDRSKIV